MKKFISDYMATHKKESNPEVYQRIFRMAAEQIVHSLGERPFHIRRGINAAVFDSVMVAFARADAVPDDIQERYEALKENQGFTDSTTASTTDVNTVQERLELAYRVLFQ